MTWTIRTAAAALLVGGASVAALTGSATAADSIFDVSSTKNLYELCSMPNTREGYIAAISGCWGFVMGAVQYHDAVSDRETMKRLICYPATATLEDGRRVFVAYVEANEADAEKMDELAVIGLVRALATEYPCTN